MSKKIFTIKNFEFFKLDEDKKWLSLIIGDIPINYIKKQREKKVYKERILTEEQRRNMSRPCSKETKKKMSEIRFKNPTRYWLGKKRSKETKLKIGKGNKGKEVSTKSKMMMSETRKKGWQDPIVWERYSKARKKMWREPKFRERLKESHKKKWSKPEFREMMAIARNMKPNSLEQFFDEMTPDSIRYTGGGGFFIRCKNRIYLPDFKVRGQKKVIELFGNYWHKGEDPDDMIQEYAEAGWECKVFWENEVYNETGQVLEETLEFIGENLKKTKKNQKI